MWSDFCFFTQKKSTGSPVQQLPLEGGRSYCFQIETMHLRAPDLLVRKFSVALRTVQSGAQFLMTVAICGKFRNPGGVAKISGRWVASVKLPVAAKSRGYLLHSSIWLTENPSPNSSGCAHEIDVVEQEPPFLGNESYAVAHVDAFEGGKNAGGACKGGWLASHYPTIGAHGDWSSDWSVFQLDWTENWLTMSVNGKLYANYDRNASGGERLPALNQPMFLWLTACVMNRVSRRLR